MSQNVEIKAELNESVFQSVRAIAEQIATSGPEIIEQVDTYFECNHGRLKFRLFADGTGELISYRRPDQTGPKTSTYVRTPCPDPDSMIEALTSSLGVRGVVQKRRELFLVNQTRIHLDQVRGLGTFLELEVVLKPEDSIEFGQDVAHKILKKLGVDESNLESFSYVDLVEQNS